MVLVSRPGSVPFIGSIVRIRESSCYDVEHENAHCETVLEERVPADQLVSLLVDSQPPWQPPSQTDPWIAPDDQTARFTVETGSDEQESCFFMFVCY